MKQEEIIQVIKDLRDCPKDSTSKWHVDICANKLIEKLETKQLILSSVSQQRELLAISCLNNIVNPIKYLTDLAEVDEGKLDGGFAIHLTKQGMFYQELAKKALKEIDNCG